MRIISGDLKGKKIYLPQDKSTRPLRDLVKESIFNLLEHSNKIDIKIKNSNVLDLFSGTGSFGIECISRKSKMVTFVENYENALKILKKNIENLNVQKKSKIFEKSCFNLFDSNNIFNSKFDIIFIDPPYKEEKINLIIDSIKKRNLLNKKGIIIIHRHKKDYIKISNKIEIIDERNYGISKIMIGG
jgi:16S rRNA (guanine966-N2)-methyltransferase